jgi:hypothetical protein
LVLIEASILRVDAMRCLACGEEMALVEAVADETMMVPGYEHQTLWCSACGESERRLIFNSAKSSLTTSAPEKASDAFDKIADGRKEVTEILPAQGNEIKALGVWERIIEKLREREADLNQRVAEAKSKRAKAITQIDESSEDLPNRQHPGQRKSQPFVSERLRRIQKKLQAVKSSHEAEEFKRFWESLVPANNEPTQSVSLPILSPLPAPLPEEPQGNSSEGSSAFPEP